MTWGAVGTAAVGLIAKNNGPKGSSSSTEALPSWYTDAAKAAGSRSTDLMNRQYSEYSGQRVAPLSANEQQAQSVAGSMGSQQQPFMSRLQQGFTPGALDQYMNPYTDSVLGARTRAIGDEYGRQSAGLAANQAATDAFRTGRSDLARSRLDANRIRALDEATGQTKSDAFNQGMQSYFNQGSQDVAGLGATTSATGQRIGALSSTGATARGVNQSQNDFNYGQFLERRDWDVNNMGPMMQFLQSAKTGGTTTGTSKQSSGAGGWIGAAAGLVGAFMQNSGNGLSSADNQSINNTVTDPGYIPSGPTIGAIGG